MIRPFKQVTWLVIVAGLLQATVQAQTYFYTNFNKLGSSDILAVGGYGSGGWQGNVANGAAATGSLNSYTLFGSLYTNYMRFEGDISNLFQTITPVPANSNAIYVQLFVRPNLITNELPDSSVCPDRQGGVCFSNNVVGSVTNGDVYAWSTNQWLLLTNVTSGVANPTITNKQWVDVLMLANYSTNNGISGANGSNVLYEVWINGTNMVPVSSGNRYTTNAPNPAGTYILAITNRPTAWGVSGFYLSTATDTFAAVDQLSVSNGITSIPLSTSIGISAFQGAGGVYYVDLQTAGQGSSGFITLQLLDAQGHVIWSDSQPVNGSPSQSYRFAITNILLSVGSNYNFQVVDENNVTWGVAPVTVTAFAANLVQMTPTGTILSFNSIPGYSYDIQWTSALGTSNWVTVVTNFTAFTTPSSKFVPFPDPQASAAFFRIIQH